MRQGDPRERFDPLDGFVEDILNASDEQLLAEAEEDFGSPTALAAEFDSIVLHEKSSRTAGLADENLIAPANEVRTWKPFSKCAQFLRRCLSLSADVCVANRVYVLTSLACLLLIAIIVVRPKREAVPSLSPQAVLSTSHQLDTAPPSATQFTLDLRGQARSPNVAPAAAPPRGPVATAAAPPSQVHDEAFKTRAAEALKGFGALFRGTCYSALSRQLRIAVAEMKPSPALTDSVRTIVTNGIEGALENDPLLVVVPKRLNAELAVAWRELQASPAQTPDTQLDGIVTIETAAADANGKPTVTVTAYARSSGNVCRRTALSDISVGDF